MALYTFGKTTEGAVTYNANADSIAAAPYTATASGKLIKITVRLYHLSSGSSEKLQPAVYADNAGAPGALLAVGDVVNFTGTTTPTWIDLPFTGTDQIDVTNGTIYWLAWGNDRIGASHRYMSDTTGATNQVYRVLSAWSFGDAFPDPLTALEGIGSTVYLTSRDADVYGTIDDAPGGGGGATNGFKVWNGTAWEVKPVKVYNGSTWEAKPLKRWNGAAWEAVEY